MYDIITFFIKCYIYVISMGGGGVYDGPNEAKFSEYCHCSHNNNTVLIRQTLFDTALVMTNTFQLKIKKI